MKTTSLTRLAMMIAGLLLTHQVAAKAIRDATFLSTWGPTALPAMVAATAIGVIAAVPLYARLLARLSPGRIVPAGFALSAVLHAIEWRLPGDNRWVAVVIYLHVAGLGALLLSGFWSVISEVFDPRSAKSSYGRIAAAGTLGGCAGGLVMWRLAAAWPPNAPLLFLAIVHAACAAAVFLLGRASNVFTPARPETSQGGSLFPFAALRAAPHLKTLALMVVASTAGAFVVDYLVKVGASERYATPAALRNFFALFYALVPIVTFAAQMAVGPTVRRFGLGRTISTLPFGVAGASAIALLFKTFPTFVLVRGVESVLHGSLFRSGYELLFVPMDPDEKRRTKTFLDVTCDRGGDMVGAVIVQALWLLTPLYFRDAELLAVVIALAGAGIWLGRRLDVMYLGVVERRLVKAGDHRPIVVGSEAGWTVIELPQTPGTQVRKDPPRDQAAPAFQDDPRSRSLLDLRSGDRGRVEAALARMARPERSEVAQIVQLLAWDDVVVGARKVLETVAPAHVGLLVDELLDSNSDFTIRRRIPRILGMVPTERALDGLIRGLDDSRFEVRYQCGRAIDRLLTKDASLTADPQRVFTAVERELSVPPQIWHGYQLIDRVERDEDGRSVGLDLPGAQRNLEHVFFLLSAVLPREPLQVAFHGIQSENAGLRGLAIEYLESVLPSGIRSRLWALLDATPDPAAERVTPERALERLRQSAQVPISRAVPDDEPSS